MSWPKPAGKKKTKGAKTDGVDEEWAWDDVNGGEIPLNKVREARAEDVDYMHGRSMWEERPIEECWARTGKPPATTKRVDTSKGGVGEWVVRCRLVGRDFKGADKDRDDLFLEARPPPWRRRGCCLAER